MTVPLGLRPVPIGLSFVVALPYRVAAIPDPTHQPRPIWVKPVFNQDTGNTHKGHWRRQKQRSIVRPDIQEWLKANVPLDDYYFGRIADPTQFWFRDKAKAALFKLFFHP